MVVKQTYLVCACVEQYAVCAFGTQPLTIFVSPREVFLRAKRRFIAAMGDKTERTYIMVKPDGVQRALTGEIIKRFEQKGFKMVAMKFMQVHGVHGL